MLRSKHFVHLVNEAVDAGFELGVKTFMEGLEEELSQDQIFESFGGVENFFNNVLAHNIINEEISLSEGVENVTDEMIDQLLSNHGYTE